MTYAARLRFWVSMVLANDQDADPDAVVLKMSAVCN
jgi:hypothetical protein